MKVKKRIRKIFAPKYTEGEKFLLKMQKQKIVVQAFYIAMAIAFVSALVKLLVSRASALDALTEELIIFLPVFYIAVRRVNADLASAKKVNVREAYPVLFLCAAIAGLAASALGFAVLFIFARMAQAAFDLLNAAVIAGAVGLLTAVVFYFIFWLIVHKNNSPEAPPPAA